MYYVTKNYRDRSGNRDVIGGELLIKSGATLTVEDGVQVNGLAKGQARYMADVGSDVTSVAALRAMVNNLLALLRLSGLMTPTAPTLTVTDQPDALELVAGTIDAGDTLTVAVLASDGSTPTYQWYSNATASNAGGTAINGATGASYAIPTNTTAGTYHYYCVASHEGVSIASNAVNVVVAAA